MLNKIAFAQLVLRKLHEKQAGIALPLAAGVGLAGAGLVAAKGLKKGREYKAGFQPGGL